MLDRRADGMRRRSITIDERCRAQLEKPDGLFYDPVLVSHFKFLLDQGVKHLRDHFAAKQVVTLESLGMAENTPDPEIIDVASTRGFVLVAANRKDFLPMVEAHVAKSTDKTTGCRRVLGMVLLAPNDAHVQRRALAVAEKRLTFEGKKITWKDVHDRELLVEIEASGAARVSRLPRCPHCGHYARVDKSR